MSSCDPSREASTSSVMMRNISRVASEIAKKPSPQTPRGGRRAAAALIQFRRCRSDVPLDGFVTPPREYPERCASAPSQTASPLVTPLTRQLDLENRSQCSEISVPDNPPSPDESDTSIADYVVASEANYVGDEIQQSNERACKSQSQLESDAESKQKQINRVFMNLKIAEKVSSNE